MGMENIRGKASLTENTPAKTIENQSSTPKKTPKLARELKGLKNASIHK